MNWEMEPHSIVLSSMSEVSMGSLRARPMLFVVTSYWAYGELLIAIEFAIRARAAGYQSIFLIPPSHRSIVEQYAFPYTTLIPHSGAINRALLLDIQYFHKPGLVILADFLNYSFCERHYGLTIDDLKLLDAGVGTFDNFGWQRTHGGFDTYGFQAQRQGNLAIDTYAFRLQPCPLNRPQPPEDRHTHAYALLEEPRWQDATAKEVARRQLGINHDKVVLLTTARWQHSHAAYPRVERFVQICNLALEQILLHLGEDVAIISIGPSLLFSDRPPANFYPCVQVLPNEFALYMAATDLFLANNICSTTLHRVILSGIPAAVLYSSLCKVDGALHFADVGMSQNGLSQHAAQLLADVEYCYPFRMFPVGWYYFLNTLLQDNDFCNTYFRLELFQEAVCIERIAQLLYNEHMREELRQHSRAYLHTLAQLPSVSTVLTTLEAYA